VPAGPVLSEEERRKLKILLQELCAKHWTARGYKKTSIKSLCADAGISVGTFYTLYSSKEDLFLATINTIQNRLEKQILSIVQNDPTMEGFASAIKALVREHEKIPFLYEANTPDFLSFVTKLSEDTMEKLKSDRMNFMRKFIRSSKLELKVSEQEAYAALSLLLSTMHAKEVISASYDYFAIFDFMVDNLMPSIFEQASN